jgi:hypothetical protein
MQRIINWRWPNKGKNRTTQNKEMRAMKTDEPNNKREESTYSLLVRSEERKRAVIEVVVYCLVILSAVAAILEFADEFFWFPA